VFSNEEKIASLSDLFREVRDYADLRFRYLRIDFVGKLSELLAALVLGVVLAVVIAVALLFLAYTVALALAPAVGGQCAACAIVAVACFTVGVVVYLLRRPLILNPLTSFIARIFLSEKDTADLDATPSRHDVQPM